MRRILIVACLGVLLSSCTEKSTVSPQTVMERAATASATLQSARFQADIGLETGFSAGGRVDTRIQAHGVTQDHSKTVHMEGEAKGTLSMGTDYAFDVQLEMINDSSGDMFLFLKNFQVTPDHPLFSMELLQPLLQQWWRFPKAPTSAAQGMALTPDPRLLEAQAQVMTVTADNGIVRLRGRRVHHYTVAIDPAKLMTYLRKVAAERDEPFDEEKVTTEFAQYDAAGEVWIDAETYYVQRVTWEISPRAGAEQAMTLSLRLDLMDQDQAPPISIPAGAADLPVGLPGFPAATGTAALLQGIPSQMLDDPSVLEAIRQMSTTSQPGGLPPDFLRQFQSQP